MPHDPLDGSFRLPSLLRVAFLSADLIQPCRFDEIDEGVLLVQVLYPAMDTLLQSDEGVLLVQVLYPAMNTLLQSDEWARWDETLQRMWYPSADMASFVQRAAAYQEVVASRTSQMPASGTSAQVSIS